MARFDSGSERSGPAQRVVTIADAADYRRTATTGSFGIYTFEDVEAGQGCNVTVSSKRYLFGPRQINPSDSLADVNFVGQVQMDLSTAVINRH